MDLSDDDSEASGPTTSEVLLFLTLPASAAPLSSSLMPRRHRERILEFTKTVTVTEVVNNSPQCHPGTCEVTVTNLDSGNGHPVSVNISHLHETVCQENGSGRCSPVVHVIESMETGATADEVEEISQRIEHNLRIETEGDVTFKRRGDNVVDLSFTTPVKPGVLSEINNSDKTLYYHSLKKETATEAANDLISPDSAVSESPKRYIQSDDSDSDSGSMIIHSPVARPDSGVSSSVHRVLNGKNLSISVGSSEEDDLHFQGPSADAKQEKNGRLPYYIVTSMSETVSSQYSPNTTTFFADLDTSGTTTTVMNDTTESESKPKYQKRGSEEKEKRRSILVVTNVSSTPADQRTTEDDNVDYYAKTDWNEIPSNDRRRRITMEVLFTPPTPKGNGVPPKPPRRAKYSSNQIIEHVQLYEHSLDDLKEGPKMTSTPISTLERHAKKSVDNVTEKDVKTDREPVKEETPTMSPRKTSKPPALKSFQPEQREHPLASPRRSPSSPIIVVDQDRRSSMDLLVPPKQPRRKSTITDIDWFAAFNMKEPSTPKSPRSPMAVDALREVENAIIEKKKPRPASYDAKPLAPSNINLDDVFACQKNAEKEENKCSCNACALMKMSEEELKKRFNSLRRSPTTEKRPILVRSRSVEGETNKLYADSDISLEYIFAPRRVRKEDPEHFKFYAQGPAEAREAPPVLSTNSHTEYHSITEFSSSDTELKSHNKQQPKADTSLDDVFQEPSSRKHLEEVETTVSHQKLSSAYEVIRSSSSSPRASIQLEVVHPTDMKPKDESTDQQTDISLEDVFAPQTTTSRKEWTPRRERVHEATSYIARRSEEEEKPRRKPAEYVDSDISLENVFATEGHKNKTLEEDSKSKSTGNMSTTSSSSSATSIERRSEKDLPEHSKSSENTGTTSINEEKNNLTEQTMDISMEEIFAKQPEPSQPKLKKVFLKTEEQTTCVPVFKRSEVREQLQRPADYTESDISLDDVFNQTNTIDTNKEVEHEKISLDAVFEPAKSEEEIERPSPPPEHIEQPILRSIQEPESPVVFVEHMEPQEKIEKMEKVMECQDISLDDVFEPKKVDSTSETNQVNIEKVFSSEKPTSNESQTSINSNKAMQSSSGVDSSKKEITKLAGYQESDISLEDFFEQKLPKKNTAQVEAAGINLDDVFSPKTEQREERRSPPPEQEEETHKPILEAPTSVVFIEHQEEKEKVQQREQKEDAPVSLDEIFESEQNKTSSSDHDIDLETVFSSQSQTTKKCQTLEAKSTDVAAKASSTNREQNYTEMRPKDYAESDISLNNVFATNKDQETVSKAKTHQEKCNISLDEELTFSARKADEKQRSERPPDYAYSDISLDDIFEAKTATTKGSPGFTNDGHGNKKISLQDAFASKTLKDTERRSPKPDQEESAHIPIFEEPEHIVFVEHQEPKEEIEHENKVPIILENLFDPMPPEDAHPVPYAEARPKKTSIDQTDANKSIEDYTQSDISLDDVFGQSASTSAKVESCSSEQNRLSSEEKFAASAVPDVSWLEELLTPNLQPNEEELYDTVQKLHDKVISTEQHTNEKNLNETVESGYTSLDRSKSNADRSHDVSLADNQVDLDAVFGPIRSDSQEVQTRKSVKTTSKENQEQAGGMVIVPVGVQIDHSSEEDSDDQHIIPSEEDHIEDRSKSRVAVESRKESFSGIHTSKEHESSESSSQSGEAAENEKTASSIDFSWIESVINAEQAASAKNQNEQPSEGSSSLLKPTEMAEEAARKTAQASNPSKFAENEPVNFSWVQTIIEESKKTSEKRAEARSDESSSDEEIPPFDDIIEKVFGTACKSVEKGKACTCSACQLTNMSPSELKEFWKRMKKQETQTIPPEEGNGFSTIISKDDRSEALEATVDLEDVFARTSEAASEKPETVRKTSKESEEKPIDQHQSRDASPARPAARQKTAGKRSVLADDVPFMVDLNDIFPSISGSTNEDKKSVKEEKVERKPDDSRITKEHNKRNIEERDFSVHKKPTEESWIQDIISVDVTEPEEADTFEASYLQSIKETPTQNMDDNSSYDNYYRLQTAVSQKSHSMRHVDDYYDEPEDDDESVEDIDVGDLVNDILSSSMNEAVFRVAAKNYSKEESHRTDTSVDRKAELQQQMYLSTADSDNRMESILSYPPSTSSYTTPHSFTTGEKFISEASVVMSNTIDDDYFIRLIFANQEVNQDSQPVIPNLSKVVVTESEVVIPSDSASNHYETSRKSRVVQSERHSQHTMTKTDEEILEVEVNQDNFIIKGNYAIVINKHDPLGVLLSELTSNSSALDFSVTPKIRRLLLQCLKEKAKPNIGNSLSSRAREILCRTDPAYKVFYQMQEKQYTKENTSGNVNLCTAENNLCNELVEERFRQHPELFVPDYKHIIHYGPPGGHPEIKNKLCEYLRNEHSADVQDELLVLLPSGNATYDLLCHCLFDSDDVILTNTPTYSRNFVNVSDRAQCHLAPVEFDLKSPRIDISAYERAFVERTEQGENVKAVIVINPHNPMGIVHSAEELNELAHWADEKGLWLLVDESFSQCVHDPNTEFTSFLALQMKLSVKSVWFWSLSKDFGLPGVRLSMVHTNNRDLHYALGQLELTEPVSSLAQDFVSNFLSDKKWLSTFKEEKLRRIRAHYKFVAENLDNLDIPYAKSPAGIFVFVDFSKKLSSNSFEAEEELFNSLSAKGIFMTPGSHCKCSQPGWMRLVFACDKDQLYEAFRRFYEFFDSHSSIVGEINY